MKSVDSGRTISGESMVADATESVQPDEAAGLQQETANIPDVKIAESVVNEGSAWFENLSIIPAFATSIQKLHVLFDSLARCLEVIHHQI